MEDSSPIEILRGTVQTWSTDGLAVLPNFVVALLVVGVFIIIAKIVRKVFSKISDRIHLQPTVAALLGTVIYVVVIFAGLLIALSVLRLDKTVASVLAGLGVAGLAIGFALQGILENLISGIMVAVQKPFAPGDLIDVDGKMGTVLHTSLRSTLLQLPQGEVFVVPNRDVYQKPFTNYSSHDKRRVDISCGVSYADDLDKVSEITRNAILTTGLPIDEESIGFIYTEFGDSSVNFVVNFWINNTGQGDYLAAASDAIVAIKKAFDAEGIDIPFPIRTIYQTKQ